jgi:hypothetical protein
MRESAAEKRYNENHRAAPRIKYLCGSVFGEPEVTRCSTDVETRFLNRFDPRRSVADNFSW